MWGIRGVPVGLYTPAGGGGGGGLKPPEGTCQKSIKLIYVDNASESCGSIGRTLLTGHWFGPWIGPSPADAHCHGH